MIHSFSNLAGRQVFFNSLISMMFKGLDSTELARIKIPYLRQVSILLNFMEITQDLSMVSSILFKTYLEYLKCL